MPLVMLDALPSGQVIVNSDDIILVQKTDLGIEISMRGTASRVWVPHSTVTDVADDLRSTDNVVGIGTNAAE